MMETKRTYTIAEAATLTGLTRKAVARRVERGSLRSVIRRGRRLIPRSELVRAGLVPEEGGFEREPGPAANDTGGANAAENPPLEPALTALVRELLDRLERQGTEIASYRAITAQAESLHLEREIGELRARLASLESQQPGAAPAAPRAEPAPAAPRLDETAWLPPPAPAPAPAPAGDHPIWLPPSAHAPAPQPHAQPPAAHRPPAYPGQQRRTPVWRVLALLLEAGFIVAVAVAAWVAELRDAAVIASVGAAWLIVAMLEWIRWSTRSGAR